MNRQQKIMYNQLSKKNQRTLINRMIEYFVEKEEYEKCNALQSVVNNFLIDDSAEIKLALLISDYWEDRYDLDLDKILKECYNLKKQ